MEKHFAGDGTSMARYMSILLYVCIVCSIVRISIAVKQSILSMYAYRSKTIIHSVIFCILQISNKRAY